MSFRLLVTGSRMWRDERVVCRELDEVWREVKAEGWETITVVHGACGWGIKGPFDPDKLWGADKYAHKWALRTPGAEPEPHPANWARYGDPAGPIRNQQMARSGVDLCLAFIRNKSKGATGCANMAYRAGVAVRRIDADGRDQTVTKPSLW